MWNARTITKTSIKAVLPIAVLAIALSGNALAADKNKAPEVTPPPPPEQLTKGKQIKPTVTIVKRKWATIEEYSIGGQIYAVKITPNKGAPYYLYDSNGDGVLDVREDILGAPKAINRWKIITW